MNTSEFLKALTEASGVSGYEHAVRDICVEFASLATGSTIMGNVWGIKHDSRRQAHHAGRTHGRSAWSSSRSRATAVTQIGASSASSWAAGGCMAATMPGVIA